MTMRAITWMMLASTLPATVSARAGAQAMVQALPGTTDADALAGAMRRVAANPVDLSALLDAGDLSIRVDDLSAAASFFARAEKVDPRSGRVKAGMGSILVRAERPGEALRLFQQAEQLGLAPITFAADRGYAYDLTGDQGRAQRDYRSVLAVRRDDAEVIRRYALSLGIAGRKDEALAAIDPLTRKQDRGAWRARAFILAMNGDVAGADHIAQTMMPGGTAQGLAPFFARLPTLGAVDRAFAVHFGEVRATPERLADARLAPPLAPLPVETRPVQVAATTPPASQDRRDRRHGRDKGSAPPVEVARQQAAPSPAAVAPGRVAQAVPTALASAQPARSSVAPLSAANESSYRVPVAAAVPMTRAPVLSGPVTAPPVAPPPALATVPAAAYRPPVSVAATAPSVPTPVTPPATVASTTAALVSRPETALPAVTTPPLAATPTPPVSVASAQPSPAAPIVIPPPTPRAHDDATLARIIANLSIPASELGVVPPPSRRQPAAVVPTATVDAARDEAARDAAAKQAALDKLAAATKRAADRKAAKALAEKKAAAAERAEEAREAAEQRKAERANPERIWVQVAGGAYEGDLGKAWSATRAKAPELFAGHKGYTTPLRATNRVVTGPFKTDAEARTFVNQLKKKGVSAFTFTSEAGQKIDKLPAK